MTKRVVKVGIIGQGRSGRNIHGSMLAQLADKYRIAAVADGLADRRARAEAEYGCAAYATWEEMVAKEELDIVVNASPSELHFPITLELLKQGVNVLCEKPLAKTTEEVDQLIAMSEQTGALLAVFQNSRYSPAFVELRKVIDSGVLGRILQVDITVSGFARRWDWQTLQRNNGGSLMNTGPHPVDQALQLFGEGKMPEIVCIMDRANTFGDAEDYVKLILKGSGSPTIDIEISSASMFKRDPFIVHGTNGGLHGTRNHLEWKYFKPEEAPEQKLTTEPLFDAQGNPAYCRETLNWYEGQWELPTIEGRGEFSIGVEQLYHMLYRTIVDGAPLEVTPQQVRIQMAVMEECRKQNPHIYN